jgi:hypothetical protein
MSGRRRIARPHSERPSRRPRARAARAAWRAGSLGPRWQPPFPEGVDELDVNTDTLDSRVTLHGTAHGERTCAPAARAPDRRVREVRSLIQWPALAKGVAAVDEKIESEEWPSPPTQTRREPHHGSRSPSAVLSEKRRA